MATDQPRSASAMAIARPMPRAPPVINATLLLVMMHDSGCKNKNHHQSFISHRALLNPYRQRCKAADKDKERDGAQKFPLSIKRNLIIRRRWMSRAHD